MKIRIIPSAFKKTTLMKDLKYVLGYVFSWLYLKVASENKPDNDSKTGELSFFMLPNSISVEIKNIKNEELPLSKIRNRKIFYIHLEKSYRLRVLFLKQRYEFSMSKIPSPLMKKVNILLLLTFVVFSFFLAHQINTFRNSDADINGVRTQKVAGVNLWGGVM